MEVSPVSIVSSVRRVAKAATLAGAVLASSAGIAQAQGVFTAGGGEVYVKFVSSSADYLSNLFYRVGPFVAGPAGYTQVSNWSSGPAPVGVGTEFSLGTIANGSTITFMLQNNTTGNRFYTGPGSQNTDGSIHAATSGSGLGQPPIGPATGTAPSGTAYSVRFGFEDITPVNLATTSGDYNDLVFDVSGATITPEPSTYALMASGLIALGVAARRRRRV